MTNDKILRKAADTLTEASNFIQSQRHIDVELHYQWILGVQKTAKGVEKWLQDNKLYLNKRTMPRTTEARGGESKRARRGQPNLANVMGLRDAGN
jgi:hypothetical protein